jgi:hypothetical protein
MGCNTLSTKVRQLKLKIQEAGDGCEWDEPQDSDLIVGLEYGSVNALNVENIESNIAKSTLSKEPDQAGIYWGVIDVSFRIIGSSTYAAGGKINIHPLLMANGNQEAEARSLPVSSIDVPFVFGEQVLGLTGGATATVIKDTEVGDTFIMVKDVVGVFEAEDLQGDVLGDATATGVDVQAGVQYRPLSIGHKKLSVIAEEFGNMKTEMYNCVFVATQTQDDSNLASFTGQIIGPLRTVATVAQYRRDFAVVALDQNVNKQPAIFRNARYSIDDGLTKFVPVISGSTTQDTAVAATQRRDANSETGLVGMFIGDRKPIHTVRFELVPNSEYDIYIARLDVKTAIIQYYLGNSIGGTVYYHYPLATPTESGDEDQDNIAMVAASYNLSGTNDNEYSILTY